MPGLMARPGSRKRRLVVALATVLALALGVVDYLTGPLFSFTIFYLFPVAVVAWYVGRLQAVVLSLGCALIWSVADMETFRLRVPVPLDMWNALVRIGFFIIVSLTLSAARAALDRERLLARAIQRRLLPQHAPAATGLEIATLYRPFRDLSGDYFDILGSGDAEVVLCIADVTGKGLGPALLMANLQAAVRVLAPAGSAPEEICTHLNALVAANLTPEKFITFFMGRVDRRRRRLVYANAGHNAPLLFRGGALHARLEERGPVLGVIEDARYPAATIDLEPGDRLVMYTDGLPEAEDSRGEPFGEGRIIETVLGSPSAPPARMKRLLIDEAVRFSNGRFTDDVTMIIAQVT